jgi:hypothetical protein
MVCLKHDNTKRCIQNVQHTYFTMHLRKLKANKNLMFKKCTWYTHYLCFGSYYTVRTTLKQRYIKLESQVTKFSTVAPNTCGSSVWNLHHVTLLTHRILKWLLYFWKICALLPSRMFWTNRRDMSLTFSPLYVDPIFRHNHIVSESIYYIHPIHVSACLLPCISMAPTRQTSVKFGFEDLYENLSTDAKLC